MRVIVRLCLSLALLWTCLPLPGFAQSHGHRYLLFVGTYTNMNGKDTASKGIYAYRFDEVSGQLVPIGIAAETTNPSFLAVAPGDKFLYAVNELQHYKGESSGGVTAFALDRRMGKLSELDEVASHGADPCYISLDRSGKFLLVANYTGGTVAVFPISADGHVGEASSVEEDKGTRGPNKERQERSHAHFIETSAGDHFAYVSDLGLDRVLIYKFDSNTGKLGAGSADDKDFLSATLAPGTGPRHLAFSSDGKFMYVLGEIDSTVTVFANDKNGTWRSIQKISALPAGFSGENTAAEIAVHPNGKFLYTSNRGDDSIAVFAIDRTSGKLTLVERVPSGGKNPRNFALDPAGKHLLAANQDGGNIVEFTIDPSTGKLTTVGEVAKVPAPVCLVFVPE
ncbi:MAG TPA: lactonase family protein [Terriglobales bacterium]|nr:lactonase family protein [Terriglobales bacterium]